MQGGPGRGRRDAGGRRGGPRRGGGRTRSGCREAGGWSQTRGLWPTGRRSLFTHDGEELGLSGGGAQPQGARMIGRLLCILSSIFYGGSCFGHAKIFVLWSSNKFVFLNNRIFFLICYYCAGNLWFL